MGRTPVDAETKAANRRATLERYAQKHRETLREAARVRMQRVRAQDKDSAGAEESRARARAWAVKYRESHRDEIRAADAARRLSVKNTKTKSTASVRNAKKKSTAKTAKRTTQGKRTAPLPASNPADSAPPRAPPANAGYLIPFSDPSFIHNKAPASRAPRARKPSASTPPRPRAREPAASTLPRAPPGNIGYLIPFSDPSFIHNKAPPARAPRARKAASQVDDATARFAWPGRLLPYDPKAVVTANQKRCRALRRCGLEDDNGEDSDADLPPGMCGCDNPMCMRLHKNESKKRREWKASR
ncbi:hypothetical protein C8F04DRAFT_1270102 [Mycena alexandri]|uniref:Uncharacterized protein n=1 Tax=Mycena alexandri TaxID=1745969 RepID=A0AAD6WRN3_9AGAR|nr:hypothetical protein C8F04DRAFT_1270102 [Mycena alexandri]